MPVVVTPNSSLPSCRIGPGWLCTSKAIPTFARRPNDGTGTVSRLMYRASLRRYDGYVTDSCVLPRSRARWGCHIPCQDTDAEDLLLSVQDAQPRWSRESPPGVWYRGRSQPPRRCPVAHHPPLREYCAWFPAFLGQLGSGQLHPPQTGLAHGCVSRLPFPIHRSQFIAHRFDVFPNSGEQSDALLSLEGTMDCAVVSQRLGQLVPLAPRAHAKDDSVEHLPRVFPLPPGALGRIKLSNEWLNLLPKVIRNFPDRIKCILLRHVSHPPIRFGPKDSRSLEHRLVF